MAAPLLLAVGVAIFLPACQSTPQRGPQAKTSAMPWDRPEAGEGAGMLGGMLPQGGGY